MTPLAPLILGAFIDLYYAYDFNRPPNGDRTVYSTQPARHNELNINLAYLDVKLDREKTRGRLALQVGNSVQTNYAGEPSRGSVSGPALSRHIQEAVVGYQAAPDFWIDAGIYFSHIGLESFISRDNWTYTRSFLADNSPYYQTGVRFSYKLSAEWSAQLHVVNGWQNISESNDGKAVGTQLNWEPSNRFSLSYNTFVGDEQGTRVYNDLVAKLKVADDLQFAGVFDLGTQNGQSWYGTSLIARHQTTPTLATVLRIEKFVDEQATITSPPAPGGFNATGLSVGVDAQLEPWLLWRNEARALLAKDPIFPSNDGSSSRATFLVSSLALTF